MVSEKIDDVPEKITLEIGGFFGGFRLYRMAFGAGGATLTVTSRQDPGRKTRYFFADSDALRRKFRALHTEDWDRSYDSEILDGEQWELAVRYRSRRAAAWSGSNAYPPNWRQALELFGIPEEGETAPIRKFTLELDEKSRFEAEGIEEGVFRHDTESFTIDREKERLVLRRSIGSGCGVTHRYDVRGGMEGMLSAVECCLQSEGWVGAEKREDGTGTRFYRLKAEYCGGWEETRSGAYDRSGIPGGPWSELIDAVWDFIGFYGFGGLLDKRAFLNAGRPGEIKYCSVALEEYGRTYYYRTDDEGIKIGDAVVVPFGKADTEREGTVEEIGYYPEDKVPFPLEKTKKILRKAEEEE